MRQLSPPCQSETVWSLTLLERRMAIPVNNGRQAGIWMKLHPGAVVLSSLFLVWMISPIILLLYLHFLRRSKRRNSWEQRTGVPVLVHWKWIRLGTMSLQVRSLASLSGLRVRCCHELWCSRRPGLDPALLWLWCRPAAIAQIRPLAWEPPYATGAAVKRQRKKGKKGERDECCRYSWTNRFQELEVAKCHPTPSSERLLCQDLSQGVSTLVMR